MKTIFNLLVLTLAVWGLFHIQYKDVTLFKHGIRYLEKHDIKINTSYFSKFKNLFPSWSKDHYEVYIERKSKRDS